MQSLLERGSINGLKLGALLTGFGIAIWLSDKVVASDLLALSVPLIGLIVCYGLERAGKLSTFSGMTLPALLLGSSMVLCYAALNLVSPPSATFAFATFGLFALAGLFTLWRTWTHSS